MTDALFEKRTVDDKLLFEILAETAVPEPEWEEETGAGAYIRPLLSST